MQRLGSDEKCPEVLRLFRLLRRCRELSSIAHSSSAILAQKDCTAAAAAAVLYQSSELRFGIRLAPYLSMALPASIESFARLLCAAGAPSRLFFSSLCFPMEMRATIRCARPCLIDPA
ncbi:unnamed protein product, partial [Scytosiphon promiscuus]